MVPREPTYCTVEDVAETLDLPDPINPNTTLMFSDESHPSYARVEKMILAAEDEIDRRMRRSWRENRVEEVLLDIPTYQWDENAWREAYFQNGGLVVQLRNKNILPWDPEKGDKLEVRNWDIGWRNITDMGIEHGEAAPIITGLNRFWFDYPSGRLFLLLRPYNSKFNSCRITYRYGAEPDENGNVDVPWAINRLACLTVASQIIIQDVHSVKVGIGGDISGLRDQLLSRWEAEMGRIYSSWQRSGTVHSMLR